MPYLPDLSFFFGIRKNIKHYENSRENIFFYSRYFGGYPMISIRNIEKLEFTIEIMKKKQFNTLIIEFALLFNDFGMVGVQELLNRLHQTAITTLGIDRADCGGGRIEHIQTFTSALKTTNISTLIIDYSVLNLVSLQTLLEGLVDTKVTELWLGNNEQFGQLLNTQKGIEILTTELKATNIDTLVLANYGKFLHGFPGKCISQISEPCFFETEAAKKENIALGLEGLQMLVCELRKTKIKTLDLSGNELGEQEMPAIIEGLRNGRITNLLGCPANEKVNKILVENKTFPSLCRLAGVAAAKCRHLYPEITLTSELEQLVDNFKMQNMS